MKSFLFVLSAISAVLLTVISVGASSDVASRLSPIGTVCMAGDECAATSQVADASAAGEAEGASGSARSGKDIYDVSCVNCHVSGAAGAPIYGDVAAWAPRIEKGLETLTNNAWDGIGAMPAKGLCMDCSKEDIGAAVAYIVENSQ